MPNPSRQYKLSFTDPGMEGIEVTIRAMSLDEALSYDEARMTPVETAEQLRAKAQDRARRLADVVLGWNLTDKDDAPVPITQDGVMGREDWVVTQIEQGLFQAYQGQHGPLDQAPAQADAAAAMESSLPMAPLPEPTSAGDAPGS